MRKLFCALMASVRFLACVNSLMIDESLLSNETFPTLLTHKSFSHSGGTLGLAGVGGLPQLFPTFVQVIELLFLVQSHVTSEVGPPPECLPAFGTLVGLLLGVNPLMFKNVRFTVEGFPTLAAVKESLPTLASQMMIKI